MGPTANDATIGDQMTNDDSAAIAQLIDHTLLKPEATREQIDRLCHEALEYHFASVCVNPTHISRCAELLRESDVKVCTVVGFPLGATTTAVKAYETRQAIDDGATEIDMVINVGALKSGDFDTVQADIAAVVDTAHAAGALVKVIISQYEKSLDTRFSALSLTIEKDQEVTRRLERDFLRMQADLPLHYVRREDYIRGQSVIEAKLDGLGTKVENALLRFFQNTT